jgi:hypothetical protein
MTASFFTTMVSVSDFGGDAGASGDAIAPARGVGPETGDVAIAIVERAGWVIGTVAGGTAGPAASTWSLA